MIRRKNQIDTFAITTARRGYIVTLESLKNTYSGAPRYKAVIICTEPKVDSFYNAVFTFTGHYYGARKEAEFIVNYYESTLTSR